MDSAPAVAPVAVAVSRKSVSRFMLWLLRKLLAAMGGPPIAVELWEGTELLPEGGVAPRARLRIRDAETLVRLLAWPDLHFGEAFESGKIEVQGDLDALLEAALAPEISTNVATSVRGFLSRANTKARASERIAHHYDLGNEFFSLWLDERLVYTCAYFRSPDDTLEKAQVAKLEHVAGKLDLRAGERVLELGCGWGALALHLARTRAVQVEAYNISKEQIAYARSRAAREGLSDRVRFVEGDYRDAKGTFDAVVSIGMLEHVGKAHYGRLGEVLDRTLSRTGRGLLHFISRNRPCATNAWLDRRVFPGAYMPTLSEALSVLEPRDFSILDVENLRLHYARTLREWRERFDRRAGEVEAMFGPEFVRAWRLYLTGSRACFRTGSLQLHQVVFARPTRNALPLTRGRIYGEEGASEWTAATS